MLELIALGIAGVAGVAGHIKSRSFVRRRLRFTKLVEKPGLGLASGAVVAVAAAALPIVTAVPALIVGAGIGSGVALGAKDAREGKLEEED